VRVLPNFADTRRHSPGPPSPRLVEELDLARASHVVTVVGQLCERKGQGDFLAMAARLSGEFPRARFLVVGDDLSPAKEYRVWLQAESSRLGLADAVRFLGFRGDVEDIVRASDVVALPSSFEGMPLSLLEAASCGKPIVAYAIPGVTEAVADGETGRLVPRGDVGALAAAVREYLADPPLRASVGAAARARIEREFSLEVYVARLEGLYA
jgi:glycosyltransferase involved in cell wall biosynthesis